MRHISRNIILSLGLAVPAVSAPATLLTSCSTTWGYNTPISFGSVFKGGASDPFATFRTAGLKDNNGNDMTSYLQSNYVVDARTSTNYAYSSPVTKWLYDKDSEEAKAIESQLMPLDKWERNSLGWKTSSSTDFTNNASFTGTRTNDKYVTRVNNENVIQASNIDYTASIASAISAYFAGALKYQASQINANDLTNQEALQIAWGHNVDYMTNKYSLYNGTKSEADKDINKLFYEYVFAQSNSHVTNKNHGAFLRGTSVDFGFDTFPFPTYSFDADGNRLDVSLATKKLLLGSLATDSMKFCHAGKTAGSVPAYFTAKTDGTLEITLGDHTEGGKATPVNATLHYTDYTFDNVPILVTAKGLTQRWVNPTKNDSIQPRDYYVNELSTIKEQVGTLKGIEQFSEHDGDVSIKEYTFNTTTNPTKTIQATVVGTKIAEGVTNVVDTRILKTDGTPIAANETLDGNKFIVLGSYTVREYENDADLYTDVATKTPTDYLTNLITKWQSVDGHSSWTQTDVETWLKQRNMVSLSSSITNIFPAYFLNIYNDLFKKAYNKADDTIKQDGYIIDADKIAKHTEALLGIYNRTTTEGYKASAKELTQDSKNLLGFLTFMFGNSDSTTINFKDDVVTTEGF